jgi:MoaA/NifB/PqqE/SkfB family radical SAM enzyme
MTKYFYDTRKDSYLIAEESVDFFINVGLQVTRRCNLNCIYCCESGLVADVDISTIKEIVDKLAENGLKRICITGGEPLLRNDLEDILKYLKKKNLTVTLSTNGMALNEERLKNIQPYIDNIRFSLRGLKEVHNRITGDKESFDKTIKAIKLSRKLGLPISVVVTVVSDNFEYMESLAKICEDNGVEKLYFFSLIPRGRAIGIFNKENVPIDKISREYNRVMEVSKINKWNMDIKIANFTIDGECVLVFPNGDVVSVPSYTSKQNQMILGNILKDDVKTLWKKFPFKENYVNYYRNH